ncbi:SDR family oxidoreductase [Hwanghaeella grinnelliae]|uniref:SDR family oxidoreductase n=1 Tax=Hwanghaeella grinnelliae TaxID=2500179 RepID=A0A437QTH3_9PROT|nr:SDR family oxidoreductase [Hwanghaeella grinnelliae]RVU37812.1 SDR family oxidoreductase [Hwanghaeella grinnelliae]
MAGRLAGKKCLITAAANGIGRASAELFAAEGGQVIATDLNEQSLAALAGTPNIETRVLDVLNADAISAIAEDLGAVDVLFNCAGYVHMGGIFDCDDKDWDFSFDLNVKAMFHMCKAFLPKMVEAGGGSIVNMCSVAGAVTGAPNRLAYGASKGAVLGLTRSLAADFVTQGIRVNAICPGTVETPSLHDRIEQSGGETARQAFIARQPMGRLGTAEEIANLALYLASDESSYTTGQPYIVDGGWCI